MNNNFFELTDDQLELVTGGATNLPDLGPMLDAVTPLVPAGDAQTQWGNLAKLAKTTFANAPTPPSSTGTTSGTGLGSFGLSSFGLGSFLPGTGTTAG